MNEEKIQNVKMCVFMRAIDKLNGRREREVKKTPCQKSMNVIFNLIKQL